MTPIAFSVLIPVYHLENAEYFDSALESVLEQSLKPNEIIIVKDGPIGNALDNVILKHQEKSKIPIITCILEKNQGVANALNYGLQHCSFAYVARMDADDISKPNRFEKQIAFLESHPEIDILGSFLDEFIGSRENIIGQRRVPISAQEIAKGIKKRSPFNHPTLIYKKEAVEKAGGYMDFRNLEDWHLWARMFLTGAKMGNLEDSLLWFRVSYQMYKRRGGIFYAASDITLQKYFYKIGLINAFEMIRNLAVRLPVRLAPAFLRTFFYKKILRKF